MVTLLCLMWALNLPGISVAEEEDKNSPPGNGPTSEEE